jgi:hypothetical protein
MKVEAVMLEQLTTFLARWKPPEHGRGEQAFRQLPGPEEGLLDAILQVDTLEL